MLKKMLLICGCAFGFMSLSLLAQAQEPSAGDTTSMSQQWLSIIDQGHYEQSWVTASSYFKSMVGKEQWTAQVATVRNSFGKVISRKFIDQKYSTSLPGSPDGEYVLATFATSFKNKTSAVETLVLMKDNDGQWRPAGYFIK